MVDHLLLLLHSFHIIPFSWTIGIQLFSFLLSSLLTKGKVVLSGSWSFEKSPKTIFSLCYLLHLVLLFLNYQPKFSHLGARSNHQGNDIFFLIQRSDLWQIFCCFGSFPLRPNQVAGLKLSSASDRPPGPRLEETFHKEAIVTFADVGFVEYFLRGYHHLMIGKVDWELKFSGL